MPLNANLTCYLISIFSSQRVALQEENLFKTRNSYRKLAQRAATCYSTMHYVRQLLPEYVMPLEHFIDLFDSCIFQSEKYGNDLIRNKSNSIF